METVELIDRTDLVVPATVVEERVIAPGETVMVEPMVLVSSPPPVATKARLRVLDRLLEMADHYAETDQLHQALEIYFDLLENHEDTPEALEAEDRLMMIARLHESNGELHHARAIYEKLLKDDI